MKYTESTAPSINYFLNFPLSLEHNISIGYAYNDAIFKFTLNKSYTKFNGCYCFMIYCWIGSSMLAISFGKGFIKFKGDVL